jgi:hypothetical protein
MIDFKSHERGFRHKRITLPVRSLLDWVKHNRIMINPMITYHRAWSKQVKSQFIESVLLGMPMPDFWCEENNYGELSVLEGSQHLECLLGFVEGEFELQGMKILVELEGCSYESLPFHYSSAFVGRAEIDFRVISYDTDPLLKYEFFKGINRDVYGFPMQSARNYAFGFLPDFLRELREENSSRVEFDSVERDYSKGSYKLAFDVDESFLLLVSLFLLRHDALRGVKGGYQDLLDAAMLFLHEHKLYLGQIGEGVTLVLIKVMEEVGQKLHVGFNSSQFNIGTVNYHKSKIVSVDGLVYAFVRVLIGKKVDSALLADPPRYTGKRSSINVLRELLGVGNAS